MTVRGNTRLKPVKNPDLQVVKPVKTTKYSDIDLNNWKDYPHVTFQRIPRKLYSSNRTTTL